MENVQVKKCENCDIELTEDELFVNGYAGDGEWYCEKCSEEFTGESLQVTKDRSPYVFLKYEEQKATIALLEKKLKRAIQLLIQDRRLPLACEEDYHRYLQSEEIWMDKENES